MPQSQSVPVNPSTPRVERAKDEASVNEPTMRFMPPTRSSTCNVYWALRMNSSSPSVPVAAVPRSISAKTRLATQ